MSSSTEFSCGVVFICVQENPYIQKPAYLGIKGVKKLKSEELIKHYKAYEYGVASYKDEKLVTLFIDNLIRDELYLNIEKGVEILDHSLAFTIDDPFDVIKMPFGLRPMMTHCLFSEVQGKEYHMYIQEGQLMCEDNLQKKKTVHKQRSFCTIL
jgi:hypothetical protein